MKRLQTWHPVHQISFPHINAVIAFVLAAAAAIGMTAPVFATDVYEPDSTPPVFTHPLMTGMPPQHHDLQAPSPGVADVDWMIMFLRAKHSYEARLFNWRGISSFNRFKFADTTTSLQAGSAFVGLGGDAYWAINGDVSMMRWEETAGGGANDAVEYLRVVGYTGGTASDGYDIVLRDTTLFCPRYNNTGTQLSVLILQAAPDGLGSSCSYTAYFFDDSGALKGSQAGALNEDNDNVIATSTVAGVANTKGNARVTHTCGLNNIKAKLVALEPSTGFSFDTICSTNN